MSMRSELIAKGIIRPRIALGWLGLCDRGFRDAGYAKYSRVHERTRRRV